MRGTDQQGGSDCQVVGGQRIDQAVVAVFLEKMVGRVGFEPTTNGLKVQCSTN